MIGLQAAILLLLGVCCSAGDIPDCESCVYHNNIGFVGSSDCFLYFMCIKNPSSVYAYVDGSPQTYRYETFCCAEGLSWDQEHLTCVRDSYCTGDYYERFKCPTPPTTTDLPCKYYPGPTNRTFYSPGYELMECPYGTEWDQELCTCALAAGAFNREPCTKLLDFTFANNSYDSNSCYNFVKGEPYGEPSLAGDTLCLNGEDQFLQVGFLNNWFAWNPQARTFTVCLCVLSAADTQTAGILSLNCDMVDGALYDESGESGSVLDIVVEGGEVVLFLGSERVPTRMAVGGTQWTQICVTFDNGEYNTYWNGLNHFGGPAVNVSSSSFPQNTHSAATLGYKDETFGAFKGYLDDFLFFNDAKDASFIAANYVDRFPDEEYLS